MPDKTDISIRPERFMLGSPESRAAARAMAQSRSVLRIVVEHIGYKGQSLPEKQEVPWGGDMAEIIHVPGALC